MSVKLNGMNLPEPDVTRIGRAGQPQATSGLRVLSAEECWQRLHGQRLGRIALVVGGRIEVFPVNFALAGQTIVFRTGPGTKLNAVDEEAVDQGIPCVFEVDFYDDRPASGWSVVARGGLLPLSAAGADSVRLAGVDVRPVAPGERPYWLMIDVAEISGRSFNAGTMIPYWVVRGRNGPHWWPPAQ